MNVQLKPLAAALSAIAVDNADVLRRVADISAPIATIDGLAGELGHPDASNFRKLLKRLAAYLVRDGGAHPCGLGLSPDGEAVVRALDAADRAGAGIDAPSRLVPWAVLVLNPENPRQAFDPVALAGLADTIADEGVLQNLTVDPANAAGEYVIQDGDRRFKAVELLVRAGRVDPGFLMPVVEKPRPPGGAAFVALVANSGRPLTALEEAQALVTVMEANGWSARETAKRTGRAPDGSETGVRDVQEKVKVLRAATPEQIAAIRIGELDFYQLRDAQRDGRDPLAPPPPAAEPDPEAAAQRDVEEIAPRQQPDTPDLKPRQRLALIETAHKIGAQMIPAVGGHGAHLGSFWLDDDFGRLQSDHHLVALVSPQTNPAKRWLVVLTERGDAWLDAQGITGTVEDAVLWEAREAAGIALSEHMRHAREGTYVTPALAEVEAAAAAGSKDAFSSQLKQALASEEPEEDDEATHHARGISDALDHLGEAARAEYAKAHALTRRPFWAQADRCAHAFAHGHFARFLLLFAALTARLGQERAEQELRGALHRGGIDRDVLRNLRARLEADGPDFEAAHEGIDTHEGDDAEEDA